MTVVSHASQHSSVMYQTPLHAKLCVSPQTSPFLEAMSFGFSEPCTNFSLLGIITYHTYKCVLGIIQITHTHTNNVYCQHISVPVRLQLKPGVSGPNL